MLKLCLFKANDLSKSTLHLFKVTWILLLGSLVHYYRRQSGMKSVKIFLVIFILSTRLFKAGGGLSLTSNGRSGTQKSFSP